MELFCPTWHAYLVYMQYTQDWCARWAIFVPPGTPAGIPWLCAWLLQSCNGLVYCEGGGYVEVSASAAP